MESKIQKISRDYYNGICQSLENMEIDCYDTVADTLTDAIKNGDFDVDNIKEKIVDDMRSNSQFDVIYYSDAISFLAENDPSLIDSVELASEYGYQTKDLNSELLASILNDRIQTDKIYDLDLDDLCPIKNGHIFTMLSDIMKGEFDGYDISENENAFLIEDNELTIYVGYDGDHLCVYDDTYNRIDILDDVLTESDFNNLKKNI